MRIVPKQRGERGRTRSSRRRPPRRYRARRRVLVAAPEPGVRGGEDGGPDASFSQDVDRIWRRPTRHCGTAALPVVVGTAIAKLNGPRPSPRTIKAVADIRAIEEALELYAAQHGRLPSAEEGLAALVPSQLVKFPVDPWDHPYVYVSAAGKSHVLSYGSDDKPGGEGDAADINRADLVHDLSTAPKAPLIPDATATALLLGSILVVPFVGYLATDRPPWAVGVLAGAAGSFAAILFTLGVPLVLEAGIRASMPLLIGVLFASGSVTVLLRVRYADGAVMAALVAGLWTLSGMVVE
jgi:general secretion pathway protein G